MRVGFVEQGKNVLARLRLLQEAKELVVLELMRYVFKGAEVIAGKVGRRDEKEEEVDVLTIEAFEVDALARTNRNGPDESICARMLRVRNGGQPKAVRH